MDKKNKSDETIELIYAATILIWIMIPTILCMVVFQSDGRDALLVSLLASHVFNIGKLQRVFLNQLKAAKTMSEHIVSLFDGQIFVMEMLKGTKVVSKDKTDPGP